MVKTTTVFVGCIFINKYFLLKIYIMLVIFDALKQIVHENKPDITHDNITNTNINNTLYSNIIFKHLRCVPLSINCYECNHDATLLEFK